MADTNMYMTMTYVEPERLKCSNSNCPQKVVTGKRLNAQLLAHSQDNPDIHLWARLYFCDDCYPRYQAAIDRQRREEAEKLSQENMGGVPSPTCYCPACEFVREEVNKAMDKLERRGIR